jgi:SAM-dependent methyltransferase
MLAAPRRVEAEWLDVLRPDDPRAVRSRRDLRRVNAFMLQSRAMSRTLLRHWNGGPPRSLLDLGAGDGAFMLRVATRIAPHWPGVKVTLLDRQDIVTAEIRRGFQELKWEVDVVAADAIDFLGSAPSFDIVTANLFLHHFPDQQLMRLLASAARRASLFMACEPRRTIAAVAASRLLWTIGCNDVTRHDASVSVRAGFRGRELSALWPLVGAWRLHEELVPPFTHCFAARREQQAPS